MCLESRRWLSSALSVRCCYWFCSGCFPQVTPKTGVVRASGIPVPGATVKATLADKTLTTFTDVNGEYTLEGVSDGAWTLEVQMFRFETVRKEVQVRGPFRQNGTSLSNRSPQVLLPRAEHQPRRHHPRTRNRGAARSIRGLNSRGAVLRADGKANSTAAPSWS